MRSRRHLALALALTLYLAFPGVAVSGERVPFRGGDTGHFEIPGSCANGLQVVIGGSGVATHLGRYAISVIECFDPATGAIAGSPTFVAANGDRLLGSYLGAVSPTGDPDVIRYDEVITIDGGTGRFAGATGELDVVGFANLVTGEYRQSVTGWITVGG